MKRIFRKISNFLGCNKPQPMLNLKPSWDNSINSELKNIEDNPFDLDNGRVPINQLILSEINENNFSSRLPKDANDVQKLNSKYNNIKTVYRNEKGQYASRKK